MKTGLHEAKEFYTAEETAGCLAAVHLMERISKDKELKNVTHTHTNQRVSPING